MFSEGEGRKPQGELPLQGDANSSRRRRQPAVTHVTRLKGDHGALRALRLRWEAGDPAPDIAESAGVSKSSLYGIARELGWPERRNVVVKRDVPAVERPSFRAVVEPILNEVFASAERQKQIDEAERLANAESEADLRQWRQMFMAPQMQNAWPHPSDADVLPRPAPKQDVSPVLAFVGLLGFLLLLPFFAVAVGSYFDLVWKAFR